jgi:hypothetical protein
VLSLAGQGAPTGQLPAPTGKLHGLLHLAVLQALPQRIRSGISAAVELVSAGYLQVALFSASW